MLHCLKSVLAECRRLARHVAGEPKPAERGRSVQSGRRLERLESRWPFAADLVVTELYFNPADPPQGSVAADHNDFEFIEVENISTQSKQLAGVKFTAGIAFTFPAMTLAPGTRAVVVKNQAAFQERFGAAIAVAGVYTGSLADGGETITLQDAANAVIQSFTYRDTWSTAADHGGHSLVVRDARQPIDNWNLPGGWHASSRFGGSPGAVDTGVYPGAIVVNELLAHQDVTPLDWVELHNTSTTAINIGGWKLSDNSAQPNKYTIPSVTLQPGAYLVLTQQFQFGVGPNAFAFSELGEEVVLTSPAGPSGEQYGDYQLFGATDNPVTLGRYVKSTGEIDFVATSQTTRGTPNTPPAVGPIVISEIMYNPNLGEDFIEIHNPTSQTVKLFDPLNPLNTWQFTRGISLVFPANMSIPPGGYVLLVDADPAIFRSANSVPAAVPILSFTGVFPDSTLSNSGEMLELSRPGVPEPPESEFPGLVPYYAVDRVDYRDAAPWPTSPDGNGPSLRRKTLLGYGNDPANWEAGVNNGSPGRSDTDFIGPRVTDVLLSGASWSTPPVALSVGDDSQTAPLPWSSVNRITVTFDEPVTVATAAASLIGVNVPAYTLVASIAPGVSSTTVTWTVSQPIGADRVLLDLENELILDVAGNRLDGEWIDNSSTFPSGDGVRGGDFRVSFAILPGDVDQNGTVDAADFALARGHVFASLSSNTYDSLADIDASGVINIVDLIRIRNAQGTTLPPNGPASPAASPELDNAPSPGAAASVVASIRDASPSTAARATLAAARRSTARPTGRPVRNALSHESVSESVLPLEASPSTQRRRATVRRSLKPGE